VPEQIVSVDVVLEELCDKRIESRVLWRALLHELLVGLQMKSVLAPWVPLRSGPQQEAQDLAILRSQNGLMVRVFCAGRVVHVVVETFQCFAMVVLGPLVNGLAAGQSVLLEYLAAVGGVKVNVLAAQGQDGVHEALVLVGELQDDVFEGIPGLTLNGEDVAKVVDVVLPKDLVLYSLDTKKDGLHGDGG